MELCFKDLQFPCRWVPDMGYRYGYPQYEYYGPLPYYLMTASRFLGLSIFSAVKIGFILALVLGNLSMFLLAATLFGPWGGLLSAAAYAYAPFRASDLFSRGAMGESWAFVFLPLILFGLLTLYRRPSPKSAAILALSAGGLFLTHNVSTLMFASFFGLFSLILLVKSRNKISFAKYGLIDLVWSVLVAAFFFLPVIFEGRYAHTESLISGYFNYLAHFISSKQLFLTTFWGYSSSEIGPTDDLAFFVGPLHLFLFSLSLLFALISLKKKKIDLAVTTIIASAIFLLVSLFMAHEKSTPIWQAIPILAYLQFPWRFLVPVTFFVSLGAGFFVATIKENRALIFAAVFIILFFVGNVSFFRPREWFDLTIWEKFSGRSWDKQLTISIFDYLPIYAKFPPSTPAPSYPTALDGKVSILDYAHRTNQLSFRTKSQVAATLILPQYDFPGWRITLDGKIISHSRANELGLITFSLPAGEHAVKAVLSNTPVRLFGNLSTVIFAPLALYFALKRQKNA